MLSHIYLYMNYMWNKLKYWASLYITKAHLWTAWVALTSPPYDYTYLFRIEKAKLEEMVFYFENFGFARHDKDIRWMKMAIRLLEIMIDEPSDITKVNTRNSHRFWKLGNINICKDLLYLEKVTNLYYEIRKRYSYHWWD